MTWDRYQSTPHRWPYVVQLTTASGSLYYFGGQHTYDPSDPQIAQMEAAWNRLKPTRAFNEGGDPPVVRDPEEEIRQYGEAGFLRSLAARDRVHVETLDLSRREQAAALLTRWSAEHVKTFLLQRALLPCEDRADCDRETELGRILPIIEADTNLTAAPHNWPEFQDRLKRIARSDVTNHRAWFDPTQEGHPFNDMARHVEDARDLHMITVLLDAVRRGERVFAVAGGSHVVRQQPALRERVRE
jgi:hypothetical protein